MIWFRLAAIYVAVIGVVSLISVWSGPWLERLGFFAMVLLVCLFGIGWELGGRRPRR